MQLVRDAKSGYGALESSNYFLDILSQGNTGAWVLNLPPRLRAYQSELESLLGRVFRGKESTENLELAQQMTLNWCVSKCRKIGLTLDESFQ